MQSPVNWALLGLIIERPSYAYELARRFERTYGEVLSLSSVSHVYTALAALKGRGLIEELPGTRVGAQPKPRYQPTDSGLEQYGQWLVAQVSEDRRRQELFVLQLANFTRHPQTAIEILDGYEQACLTEARATTVTPQSDACADGAPQLASRLTNEERRLSIGAKLQWVQYARRELNVLAGVRR